MEEGSSSKYEHLYVYLLSRISRQQSFLASLCGCHSLVSTLILIYSHASFRMVYKGQTCIVTGEQYILQKTLNSWS